MSTQNKLTLQSGLLVALSSSVSGGVSYARRDLDERCGAAGKDAMGNPSVCKLLKNHEGRCDFSELTAEEVTRWETTRTIADKAEHDKATKVRNKARSLVTAVCIPSKFGGNLCLKSKEAELRARYDEAKAMVDEFNRQAQFTRIELYMLIGEIQENTSSAQSISSEVIGLIDQMISGVGAGDDEMIGEAANKLTALAEILGDVEQATVKKAIAEARSAKRAIVKAKAEAAEGQTVASFTKEEARAKQATNTLKQARTALDMNADVLAQIEAATKKHAG